MLIGTDRLIFKDNSVVRRRIAHFGMIHTEALDSIVFSTRGHDIAMAQKIASHVRVYPTNSRSRLFYGFDALRIARHLPCPDIISAQDPFETGLAALLIARYWRIPLIVEIHTDFLTPSFARHSLLNTLRVLIAGFVLRHAAGGYAVSHHVRDKMIQRYKLAAPFEVLPIYVDLERFQSIVRNPQEGSMLWVGRFESEKNPSLAICAFAAAWRSGYNGRLTMLGTGKLESSLKDLATRLGVSALVEFPGWQDPATYLPHVELMLVTSRYEGYGIALVEALAAGVPVLSTDVGIAREAGAIISPDNESEYTQSLIQWIKRGNRKGTLLLHMYSNEDEYMARLKNMLQCCLKPPQT